MSRVQSSIMVSLFRMGAPMYSDTPLADPPTKQAFGLCQGADPCRGADYWVDENK